MANYGRHYAPRTGTPQTEKIPGSTQVQNSAGGYSWAIDGWARLDRFLILGAEGGSYYATEHKLVIENATSVAACLAEDGPRVVARLRELSTSGRAVKNDAAIFVLAMAAAHPDDATRTAAFAALTDVCRTGTHLFQFIDAVQGMRGWGRGLKNAVARWYAEKPLPALALQVVKYRDRNGFTHRDALRLAHPQHTDVAADRQLVYRYIADGMDGVRFVRWLNEAFPGETPTASPPLPLLIEGFERARQADVSEKELVQLIADYRLPQEAIPTEKQSAAVWHALLPQLGLTALLRNLGNLTKHGVLAPGRFDAIKAVTDRFTDVEQLKKARVHPISILSALKVYAQGRAVRGSSTWEPVRQIVDALDEAFYLAFQAVVPSNKPQVIGLDISGSMFGNTVAGIPSLDAATAAAALCLVTVRTEPMVEIRAFCHELVPVTISPKQRLDDVVKEMERLSHRMGGTDCALPMQWALQNKVEADAFAIYTDSETWAGRGQHPAQALNEYRRRMNRPARMAVVGMCSNGFTIADPNDRGMLDIVGLDTASPGILADFIAGRL